MRYWALIDGWALTSIMLARSTGKPVRANALSNERHRSMRRISLLLALSLTGAPAYAAEPYFTHSALDLITLLPPPPAPGSAADRQDLASLLSLQAHATRARRAQTITDSNESFLDMFGPTLGITTHPLPKTLLLFDRIGATEQDVLDAAKPIFGRVRPWIAHHQVTAYARRSTSPSHPSGHATRVTTDAIILSTMLPERRAAIWARAQDYAQSRIIGGMHYPADVAAGLKSGTAIAALLLEQPEFQADLAAARAELRAALRP